jgi:inorganic pyrophosphatase
MSLRQYALLSMRFKFASNPQMGAALYTNISSSNGDDGRAHFRTEDNPKAQVSNAFDQNQRQKQIDGWNETRQIPTGAWQSKAAQPKLDDRLTFNGLKISIETDKGNYRHWYDPHNNTNGKTLMKYPYGYIRQTEGLDGDHVDCFIGPNENAAVVYVITTNKSPDFKLIDEEKCMLGFNSAEDAKSAYLAHYNDPRFFNKMRAMPFEAFKAKVLKTADGGPKKIGHEIPVNLIDQSPGTHNDQTPGDYLGVPSSSLVGLRKVEGDPLNRTDKIDKAFRFNDLNMDTHTLDPNASSVPQSPGV